MPHRKRIVGNLASRHRKNAMPLPFLLSRMFRKFGHVLGAENCEIGRTLHLKAEIPKSQLGLSQLLWSSAESNLRFRDFGFEMQDSSDFRFPIVRDRIYEMDY
jgi:hypothetical protein